MQFRHCNIIHIVQKKTTTQNMGIKGFADHRQTHTQTLKLSKREGYDISQCKYDLLISIKLCSRYLCCNCYCKLTPLLCNVCSGDIFRKSFALLILPRERVAIHNTICARAQRYRSSIPKIRYSAQGQGQGYASVFTALLGMQTRSGDENFFLSVCPSDKRVHCDKTEKRSIQIFTTPYERAFSLVF